ncbi:MAG: hypothetical protein ACRCUY_04645 [Thermoguttaceae bacterium]
MSEKKSSTPPNITFGGYRGSSPSQSSQTPPPPPRDARSGASNCQPPQKSDNK